MEHGLADAGLETDGLWLRADLALSLRLKQEYDFGCMRLKIAAAVLLAGFAVGVCAAQSNGVPPSITSFGFGGSRSTAPGVPASVTSLGPLGFSGNSRMPACCFNPLFPVNPNPPFGNLGFHHHHGRGSGIIPAYVLLGMPNYQPVYVVPPADDADNEDEEYSAGPTVFEHRRPIRHNAEAAYGRGYEEGRAAAEEARAVHEESAAVHKSIGSSSDSSTGKSAETRESATPDPPSPAIETKTVLVYRDGHKEEIANYAIVGDELLDFTSGRRKIAISALDIPATIKANDERGMDFQLPVVHPGN